jgi:hypothetical protein
LIAGSVAAAAAPAEIIKIEDAAAQIRLRFMTKSALVATPARDPPFKA